MHQYSNIFFIKKNKYNSHTEAIFFFFSLSYYSSYSWEAFYKENNNKITEIKLLFEKMEEEKKTKFNKNLSKKENQHQSIISIQFFVVRLFTLSSIWQENSQLTSPHKA